MKTTHLTDSDAPDIAAARRKLKQVVNSFPNKDSVPGYEPLPPRPWDKEPEWNPKK